VTRIRDLIDQPRPPRRQPAARSVEDIRAEVLTSPPGWKPTKPQERERAPDPRFSETNWHMAADRLGEPCACDDRAACLVHWKLTGRRRHVRPK
jgi:hypothetical protein